MNKLEYYGGDGYGSSTEIGKFEVKASKTKTFNKLSEARKYFDSLNEEKAIWDLTRAPELLDCYVLNSP